MSDDLFFIPMIAKALREPDPKAAMVDTFQRIRALGTESRYQHGYQQLIDFMDSVVTGSLEDAPEKVGALILEQLDRPTWAEIVVEREDTVVATCAFEQAVGVRVVSGIEPGDYRLRLDTGRLLWEGPLTERDLIWSKAYPGRDLSMAADSEGVSRAPTREMDLLDGTVVLRVFPGVESGSLEIELRSSGSDG